MLNALHPKNIYIMQKTLPITTKSIISQYPLKYDFSRNCIKFFNGKDFKACLANWFLKNWFVFAVSGRESRTVHSTEAVAPPHFSIPFIVSVCGGVLLLIFISAFGIVVKFGEHCIPSENNYVICTYSSIDIDSNLKKKNSVISTFLFAIFIATRK